MENIAVVIDRRTREIVYVTSNSVILPNTEELDRYLSDPAYQVIVDVETAVAGRVRSVGPGGAIREIQVSELDPARYRMNLGWTADMLSQRDEAARRISEVIGAPVRVQPDQRPVLELTTDAPDMSPVNGVPEISADGQSTAKIFIRKLSPAGKLLSSDDDNDLIHLRTTRGALSDRQVRLERGRAQVTLRSTTESTIADVTAFGANLKPYMIHIEFVAR